MPTPQPHTESTQEEAAPATVTVLSPAVINALTPAQVDIIGVSSGATPPTAAVSPSPESTDDVISAETEAAFFKLLGSFPPIPLERWAPVYGFVMQVPWMISLASEDRRRDALANGQPPPPMPILNLSAKDSALIERLLRTEPSHFIPFCKQLFAFLLQHGTHVLALASVPFHPLPDEQQKQILRALRDPNSKTYLEYIYRFQDAQLHQRKLPEEPSVQLNSNQRRELKKLLVDLRAVLFFKRHALPSPELMPLLPGT